MLPKEEKIQSNKLIGRLYKQSKNKPMTLKPQLQNQSFSNAHHSPQQKYLIPRIAKQKLKPIDDDKKSRNRIFTNHLNSSKNILDRSARQHSPIAMSKVRSKIYSHLDETIALDRQFERSESKIQGKEQQEEERQKYLTPNDFMEILKIDREMSEEFCYMNRKEGPYDWQIVEFQRRNPLDYMVISKRGLTRYFHKQVEFMNFESFLGEQKTYNRLQQIYYFKIYKKHKYFQLWKKLTSVNIFKERSKQFTEKTILADSYLKQLLYEVKEISGKIQKIETFYTQTLSSMSVEAFRSYAEKEKEKTLNIIRVIQQAVLKVIIDKSEVSMEVFMKKMRISKDSKKIGQKKVPLLIGDQSGKDMPYTESATLRTHQIKIRNFLKLTDYIIISAKTNLVVNMVSELYKILSEINDFYNEDEKGFGNSWIQIQIFQDDGNIKFNPGKEIFREELEQIVYGTLASICSEHFQYLHLEQFDEYWQCAIEAEKTDEHIEIKSIISINSEFNKKIAAYKFEIKKAFNNIEKYTKIFDPSLLFLEYMKEIEVVNYHEQNTDFFKEVMYRCKTQMQNLSEIDPDKQIGIVLLKCNDYKTKIQKRCEQLTLNLHHIIPEIIMNRAKDILQQIKDNYDKIVLTPLSVKQYIEFLKNCQEVNQFAQKISPQIMDNSELLMMTDLYSIKVPEATKNLLGECNGQMIGLRRRLEEIEKKSNDDSEKFKKEIQKMIPTFDERIKLHNEKLLSLNIFKNTIQIQKKIVAIKQLGTSLATIIADKEELQKFQQQLGLEISAFEVVDEYEKYFKLVELLWDQKKIWEEFYFLNYQKNLSLLNLPQIRKYIEQLQKKLNIMQRQLDPNQVVQDLKYKLDNFKPLFYSCEALMSPSLKEKHYLQIKDLLANKFKGRKLPIPQEMFDQLFIDMNNSLYTIKFFEELEIQELESEIVNISVQALKEDQLTEMISKVQAIWKTLTITTNPYKEGKDIILGNNDDLITKIDDNLLTVNNILGSKFVGPIKTRVEVQAKMLRYMQDLIDQWYAHQRNWIYLQPILKSTFAMKNLPKETTMFNQIDSKWKHLMKTAKDSISIKRYADEINSHFTLKLLKTNNQTFEFIQKTLENFLQKKRDIFQRFYFLSNDELLEILSTVKEFPQIQPHLRKVFQNFVRIGFDDKGIPDEMISSENQRIILKNCIFRGEVEEWFKSAEESMKATLKSIIRGSLQKFSDMKRKDWIKAYPSQVVIVVDCIMWTTITESYLEDLDESDITQWVKTNKNQLNQLVEEISRDDIDMLERRKLVALITQDVHYRDIIETLQTCQGLNDFMWLQQLRFYSNGEIITSRQVQAELMYGYEYLGATTRLVITPLTDRCWMTITGALHIKLGANPAGPAGTGKTQSCKDLAKSLARYCIVFNCSDQINAQMMQKLFSGLAYTGSWTCLDEFNRIDIEVLSVIAQQVLTIREALLLGKANRELVLGGKLINLNHDVGIFITMNPGYAGRTQLPDNLKTLFRPVAMMVPDYALIAEIMLFSEGFSSAKQLSKKMTKLYKLSSEQLSQQDHYDFGMRAVKSVLVMAGSLKRAEPEVEEDVILIRAMQDSNIPKFLSHDIPLFNGIIEDLFPGTQIPERDRTKIINKVKSKCEQFNLVSSENFITKNLQLNETLKVRFGVMLVGPPMGSKTSILMTLLDKIPIIINPKSVSLAELYGNFDPVTQTWTDGLAAKLLRTAATTHDYVLFDGPVDAIWVQNLNTVLDDSMMLCLSNGQRIKLSAQMRVLFEVNDLNQASPATVSRCGMVWVSEEVVGWEQLIESFFKQNKLAQKTEHQQFLQHTVRHSFRKGYTYIKKFCKEMVKLNKNTLVHSYCKFLKNSVELVPQEALDAQTWKKALEKVCVYAYVWSIGSILSDQSKPRIDKSLSEAFNADALKSPAPNFTLSFKSKLDGQWVSWNSLMPEYEFPQNLSYSQIFVPTKQTFSYTTIMQIFVEKLDPIFLIAPTGTGKTSMVEQILRKSSHASLMFTFTAQTSPAIAQAQLQLKLQTQRKSGNITLIPPPGKKFVYFIDDINMPTIEEYGAQPPIEMLRLLIGKQGVWDRKQHIFKQVEGMEMIIAGTYGRSQLPPRFVRYFNTIYIPDLQEQSLLYIFSELTRGFFRNFKIKAEVLDLIENKSIVHSTLTLYSDIKRQLLPTPEKSHYLFNLRDVSRVFQGLTTVKAAALPTPQSLVKLWVHEFQRVFEDRLINEHDRQFIREEIGKKVTVSMKSTLTSENLFNEPIIFGNFFKKGIDRKQMAYEEAKDFAKLTKIITEYMHDETKMDLVLFSDAVKHICRVAKSFVLEKGHIVLVGLSGSGKKSSVMLGAVLAQASLSMIELRKNYGKIQFREDLFNIMKKAAFQNELVAFMFPENHMVDESFLEDINNLLSSGEVPSMFTKDMSEQITQAIGYELFLKRVLANLHVCLTLSPIGQQFRSKIRNYPSLVNCCLIDWIDKWPEQALMSVGRMILEEKSVVQACVHMQKQVQKTAEQFLLTTRRKVYITPKNYIELLNSYNFFLNEQKNKVDASISKLSNGVRKLQESSNLIEQLKSKLVELQPILEKKTVEQQNLLKKLEVDRQEASQAKVIVEDQEKIIADKTDKALLQKKQADRILNEALPALHAATQALNTLNRNDISEIKMNQNPHAQVKFTLESVSVLLQQKQEWEVIRKTISDINFITRLKNLDVYNIPSKVEEKIKKKLDTNPNFKPNEIKQINFAAKSLCQWVLAVVNFTDVNKEIVKKKTLVKKLNDELAISNKQLQVKRDELNGIISKVKDLEHMFNDSKDQKEKLDQEIILTGKRLKNASELTDGLSNEKVRWAEYLIELDENKKSIVGNVFLATCCAIYHGPYTGSFRTSLLQKSIQKLTEMEIKISQKFDLKDVLGDNLQIAEWISFGLPKDTISINSAIIVNKTLQNPMMIDPQIQSSKWIKNMLKNHELKHLKAGSDSFIKQLQSALRMHNPILIQTSQNTIDPSISALVAKEYEVNNNRYFVRLGQNKIEIEPSMKIYLFTKIANPAFSPQVFIKLCVINFTVTPAGLEDQLLADVVENQLPEIEIKRRELVNTISVGKATLQKNEDKILQLLNNSKGNILDDVQLIANLKESKKVSNEVKISLEESVIKSKEIEEARMVYQPVANRGAILYIIISELANLQSMYQFSLEYFSRIFVGVLKVSPKFENQNERVSCLIKQLTKTSYFNVSRALFNQHKKIFSFMIASRIQEIPRVEYEYFLKGNFIISNLQKPKTNISNLKEQVSTSLFNLKQIFQNELYQIFLKTGEKGIRYFDENPYKAFKTQNILTKNTQQKFTPFQNLLITKVLKPELTVQTITQYISDVLGAQYVDSTTPTMNQIFSDASSKIPLIFILSVGADPLQNLLRLSKQLGQENVIIISLGQGQGGPALRALSNSSEKGGWVILQNCHLGKSFMPILERKVQEINQSSQIQGDFRLFLTSMPCDYFPISILQNSLKVTSQPPRGIKANLKQLVNGVNWNKSDDQKTLMFSLCFFHAIVLERRKFGSLGWNILYDFNQSDLETSLTIVNNMMENYSEPPWDAIQYFIGEIVYGGRVTDDFDRRLLKTMLKDYVSPQCLDSPKVKPGEPSVYANYVDSLPEQDHPEIFGMNLNAQTTYLMKIANQAMESIMMLEPQQALSNDTAKTLQMISQLVKKVPVLIKSHFQDKKNPDAIDICLEQESERFNKLLSFINTNLKKLMQAVKGEIIMSDALESTFNSLTANIVPKSWEKKAYPSMKPFASWFEDLIQRVQFFRDALIEKPKMYWISAFFFPQGFLTSVLQIYARKMKLPVDTLNFMFVFRHSASKDANEGSPADGCLVYGLYSEACTIDFKTSQMKQSPLNVIESEIPVIHFKPVEGKATYPYPVSQIPLYKTKKRAGTLSTTGHSTNYIISISSKSEQEESFWIKRGAAFLCALDR